MIPFNLPACLPKFQTCPLSVSDRPVFTCEHGLRGAVLYGEVLVLGVELALGHEDPPEPLDPGHVCPVGHQPEHRHQAQHRHRAHQAWVGRGQPGSLVEVEAISLCHRGECTVLYNK